MRERTITFLGKRWRVRWVSRLGPRKGREEGWVGCCDPPDAPNKIIRVRAGQEPSDERESIIHELTHAAFWSMDGDHVRAFAANLNAALTKLGFPAVKG